MLVTDEEFAGLLKGFEPRPRLAVAVSGGADSMALAWLAHRWAQARGGSVLALTVDHRLRPESTAEAASVGYRLAALGIAHAILTWDGDKPSTGLQEAARAARYRLLFDRCTDLGIFHLLLGHHRDDQAETLLQRLAHGSGLDGLAGMAAMRETPYLRLLRPLLTLPKARLIATCTDAGIPWIDDPSNRAPRFARARLRTAGAALSHEGLSPGRLAASANRLGHARTTLDQATAHLLGASITIDPAGFLMLDPLALSAAPDELGQRALARALAVVGGNDGGYPPRHERLLRLYHALAEGTAAGRTLAGCQIVPYQRHLLPDTLLLVRETVAMAPPLPLPAERRIWWDRRFLVRRSAALGARGPVTVGALGAAGWRVLRDRLTPCQRGAVPGPVRATLPALWDQDGVLAAPHLGYRRDAAGVSADGADGWAEALFVPSQPLAGPTFAVA